MKFISINSQFVCLCIRMCMYCIDSIIYNSLWNITIVSIFFHIFVLQLLNDWKWICVDFFFYNCRLFFFHHIINCNFSVFFLFSLITFAQIQSSSNWLIIEFFFLFIESTTKTHTNTSLNYQYIQCWQIKNKNFFFLFFSSFVCFVYLITSVCLCVCVCVCVCDWQVQIIRIVFCLWFKGKTLQPCEEEKIFFFAKQTTVCVCVCVRIWLFRT